MKIPGSLSLTSTTIIFTLYSISLFTSGAHAQSQSADLDDLTLNSRRLEVEIENYGTVELTLTAFNHLEIADLPDIDVRNAVVRSEGPTTCFFHKWPIKGFPDDDGFFISIPLRTDNATAERFEEFDAAQRVLCYDSSEEWGRSTTTLLFQQDQYFSLQSVPPTERGGSGKWINYQDGTFPTRGKRLNAVALLYPARREAYCRLFNTFEDLSEEDRRRFRDYRTVYFESPRMMNPDVRVRRIECI